MSSNILLVSDDKSGNTSLSQSLSNHFTLKTANSPLDAFNMIQKQHFDVVIANHDLSSMSGTEFLESIAQNHPKTQRILITNGANPLDLIRAINKAKIHSVALKPINTVDLLALVNDAISNLKNILAKENRISELQTQNEQFEFILRQRLLT